MKSYLKFTKHDTVTYKCLQTKPKLPAKCQITLQSNWCKSYLMPGATHDGGEDSPGGIISSKTGFAHTRAIVNNESGDFLIHVCTKRKKIFNPKILHNIRYKLGKNEHCGYQLSC